MREVGWAGNVLTIIGFKQKLPTEVNQDNLCSIPWTNAVHRIRKVKHISIKYHTVREAVLDQTVALEYEESAKNRPKPFTKALIGDQFSICRNYINIRVEST